MALQVKTVEVWSGLMPDQAGALDRVLEALAAAGANLECVVGRRQPDQPGMGHVYLTPIKGKKVVAAAQAAGLAPVKTMTLRVEGPNKPGSGHAVMAAVAAAGVNVRGVSMIALGNKSVAFIGLDSAADAAVASKAIKAADKRKK